MLDRTIAHTAGIDLPRKPLHPSPEGRTERLVLQSKLGGLALDGLLAAPAAEARPAGRAVAVLARLRLLAGGRSRGVVVGRPSSTGTGRNRGTAATAAETG